MVKLAENWNKNKDDRVPEKAALHACGLPWIEKTKEMR